MNDSTLSLGANGQARDLHRKPDTRLHFRLDTVDTTLAFASGFGSTEHEATVTAYTSLFGGDPTRSRTEDGGQTSEPLRFSGTSPLTVIRPGESNRKGCSAHEEGSVQPDAVLFVERGECSFIQKLSLGKAVGAAGVIVASDTNVPINPTADSNELEFAGVQFSDVALVVVGQTDAQLVSDLLDHASTYGIRVRMLVENPGKSVSPHRETDEKENDKGAPRILYVNGRPLINVELLV
jgi:ER degradation enhancer, mannosidase alpha-like 1